MPAQLTTKPQVSGYRFTIRRMEHALVRRDVRMLHEPMRRSWRALGVGGVLGALVMAGFGIAAWLSPAPDTADAAILLDEDGGGLYVRVRQDPGPGGEAGTVLHPVLNLASARLVVGSADEPLGVAHSRLPDDRRGPLVGIPGAPHRLPGPGGQASGPWSVCDELEDGDRVRTIVLAGGERRAGALAGGEALLVEDGDGARYVLTGGRRFAVDPSDLPMARALGLAGTEPVGVSSALISALPEGPALRAPRIDGAGEAAAYPVGPARIGDVVRVRRRGQEQYFAVLRGGIAQVPPVAADLIVYRGAARGARMRDVPAAQVASAPDAREMLPVQDFPAGPLRVRGQRRGAVCARWEPGPDGRGSWTAGTAGPAAAPIAPDAVRLVGADGAGPGVDAFAMAGGDAAVARPARPGAPGGYDGPRYLIDETGVRYGIPDAATAAMLGLGDDAAPAPWPVLALLPSGPALTRTDAMVVHNGLEPDPAPGALLTGG